MIQLPLQLFDPQKPPLGTPFWTPVGRPQNEDAFLIGHGKHLFAALADGAGNAERVAKRVLTLFEKLLSEAAPEQIASAETWIKWVRLLLLIRLFQQTATSWVDLEQNG
jgi:hypothetical protein